MTEAPMRVRAVARVSPAAPPPTSAPRAKPRPGYFGSVHVLQIFLVQAAVLGVVAALLGGVLVTIAAVLAAALLVAAVLMRYGGRWWYEQRLIAREYRRRRRTRPDVAGVDGRVAALRVLAPGLTVQDLATADAAPIGVVCDPAGWYAVIAVGGGDTMLGEQGPGVPLDVLARALDETTHPGAVLQVVTQSVPAPNVHLDGRHMAARSYVELRDKVGPVPADRTTWVAVRLEARSRAELGLPGRADGEYAPAQVAALIRKVSRSLRDAGIAHHILPAEGAISALVRACGLAEGDARARETQTRETKTRDTKTRETQTRETWNAWHSGELAQATFWVREWPTAGSPGTIMQLLGTLTAASATVSVTLAREGTEYALRCLVRVAAPAAQLGPLTQDLTRAVRSAGGQLFRLDGEQAPATYASAPTGGGAK